MVMSDKKNFRAENIISHKDNYENDIGVNSSKTRNSPTSINGRTI